MTGGADGPPDPDARRQGDPSPPRRALLRALSVPPVVAALAGCETVDTSVTDDTGDEPDGGEPDDGTPEGEATSFEEAIAFADAHELEVAARPDADLAIHVTGRVDGEAVYLRTERPDQVVETYRVDGTTYVVTDDGCVRYSAEAGRPEAGVEPAGDPKAAVQALPRLIRTDRGTLDGHEVIVYKLPAEAFEGLEADLTYYVDADSGHIRRLETASVVVDYAAWGDVDPVEPPEVDCRRPEDAARERAAAARERAARAGASEPH